MTLTPDAQALLLLCSHLGLPSNPDPAPLTLREWNPLARKLQVAALRPGDLLEKSAGDFQAQFALSNEEADRLVGLF